MKKIVSLILSLLLLWSMCVPAFAAEETAVKYEGDPIVIVRGIDFGENSQLTVIPYCFANKATKLKEVKMIF